MKCCNGIVNGHAVPLESDLFPLITLEPLARGSIQLSENDNDPEIETLFPGQQVRVFGRARDALVAAVQTLVDSPGELPRIGTFSDSGYLSSCVTSSLGVGVNMAGGGPKVFVSDFGYGSPIPNTMQYEIFDDAWSFRPDLAAKFFDQGGKYYISSLPKVFGLPMGGLLLAAHQSTLPESELDPRLQNMILSRLKVELESLRIIQDQRLRNMAIATENLKEWTPRFNSSKPQIYGATILRPGVAFNEVRFKEEVSRHGIRTTSFFGNQSVLIPNHQLLSPNQLPLICELVRHSVDLASE